MCIGTSLPGPVIDGERNSAAACNNRAVVTAENLAASFLRFGVVEAEGHSPLYAALSPVVAESAPLLELAAEAREGQPVPNLFFSVVHYVLQSRPGDPLARYFASTGGSAAPDAALASEFERFCAENSAEITALMRSRLVQTNEVRRSAVLLPALRAAANDAQNVPLALIEIGPAAGLNLVLERYAYDYGAGLTGGLAHSPVRVDCDARGTLEAGDIALPSITSQIGLDVNPLDVGDDRDVRWLRALIWPEHTDRRQLLDAAVTLVRKDPPLILGVDLFGALPGILAMVQRPAVPVVFAAHVLNQFTPDMRARLRQLLEGAAATRDVYFIVQGFSEFAAGRRAPAAETAEVWLMRFGPAGAFSRLLAVCNPHGRWLEFQRESEWQAAPADVQLHT